MKKLYNKYFYVSKHEKISDKVMLARAIFTLTFVVMCLFAMSITAYAYFSSSVTSGGNIITSANYELDIKINGSAIDVAEFEIPASSQRNEIQIELGENNTATTGFCVIKIEREDKENKIYYTTQIGIDQNSTEKERKQLTFYLKAEAPCKVTFISHWGTSVYYEGYNKSEYYIGENQEITVK